MIADMNSTNTNESHPILKELHGDWRYIQQQLSQKNQDIAQYYPPHISPHREIIAQIEGTPATNFTAGVLNCMAALITYPTGALVAKTFTALTPLERRILASAPLLIGGLGRILLGISTDHGYGKEAIILTQLLSILGIGGIILLIANQGHNFAATTAEDTLFWGTLFLEMIVGLPIAIYAAGMPLTARQAMHDAAIRQSNLDQTAAITGVPMTLNWWEQKQTQLIRRGPAFTMAITAAIGNIGPAIGILVPLVTLTTWGLLKTQAFFLGIQTACLLSSYFLTSNTIYDQCIRKGLSASDADTVAGYMGQKARAPHTFFSGWTQKEKTEIFNACAFYVVFYGLLVSMCSIGPETLQAQGVSETHSKILIAAMAILSSLFRGFPIIAGNITPRQQINAALALMLGMSLISQFSPKNAVWSLLIFGIANGIGNGAVVDEISREIPQKIGVATSLSTGVAAFLAFVIGIAALESAYTPVILCTLGVFYSIFDTCNQHPSALQQHSLFLTPRKGTVVQQDEDVGLELEAAALS